VYPQRFATTFFCLAALVLTLAAIPISAQAATPVPAVGTDGDGLTGDQESGLGTDPHNPDTDGDGARDGIELYAGTDPLEASSSPSLDPDDADLDGLTDDEEAELGTDPTKPDSDGDGLADGREVNEVGTDPLSADTDGDGAGDGEEVEAGTDPRDPDSYPALQDPPQDAEVTIHNTWCPPGYSGDDYSEDCDGPVIRQDFFLGRGEGGVSGTTDNAGIVTLVLPGEVLPGLATAQTIVPPIAVGDFVVSCTKDDGATILDVEQAIGAPGPEGSVTYLASFDVAPGDQIRCDWYDLTPADEPPDPDTGSLIIGVSTCPQGYDGEDFAADCATPAAGVDFEAGTPYTDNVERNTTRPDGLVTFSLARFDLDPTGPDPLLVLDDPQQAADYAVICSKNGGTPVEVQPGLHHWGISFEFETGDDIACEWYNIPSGEEPPGQDAGSLTIYATSCPPGYTGDDYFDDCYGNPAADLEFAAYNQKSDFRVSGATDADGFVTLPLPAEGLVGDLVNFGQSPPVEVPGGAGAPFVVSCALDNGQTPVEVVYDLIQLDPGGDAWEVEISYLDGQDIFCDWYRLPAGSEPTEPPAPKPTLPVNDLPSTGAGAAEGEAEETSNSAALALILAGGLGIVGAIAIGRRRLT
jgi:hypothetical protein